MADRGTRRAARSAAGARRGRRPRRGTGPIGAAPGFDHAMTVAAPFDEGQRAICPSPGRSTTVAGWSPTRHTPQPCPRPRRAARPCTTPRPSGDGHLLAGRGPDPRMDGLVVKEMAAVQDAFDQHIRSPRSPAGSTRRSSRAPRAWTAPSAPEGRAPRDRGEVTETLGAWTGSDRGRRVAAREGARRPPALHRDHHPAPPARRRPGLGGVQRGHRRPE